MNAETRARLARLAVAFAAAAAFGAGPAAAGDLGESVVFDGDTSIEIEAAAPNSRGERVFESAPSREQAEAGDTVLFHGEGAPKDARFEVSRRLPNGQWGPWVAAQSKRYDDGRFWGKAEVPLGTGSVRVRAICRSSTRKMSVYSVETFLAADSEPKPGATRPTRPTAGPGRPAVHLRGEWGAVPPKDDYEPQVPNRITYHHSDGKYTTTLDDTLQEVKVIQDFHMHGRGWTDIAYHYLIDAAGNIVEGRPELVVGAHAGDHDKNLNNVGVCFLGTFHEPKHDPVTREQLEAFVALGRYLVARHHMRLSLPNTLKGHRDYKSTDCPGDDLYAKKAWLKQQMMAPAAPAAPGTPPGPGIVFRPVAVVAPRFD